MKTLLAIIIATYASLSIAETNGIASKELLNFLGNKTFNGLDNAQRNCSATIIVKGDTSKVIVQVVNGVDSITLRDSTTEYNLDLHNIPFWLEARTNLHSNAIIGNGVKTLIIQQDMNDAQVGVVHFYLRNQLTSTENETVTTDTYCKIKK